MFLSNNEHLEIELASKTIFNADIKLPKYDFICSVELAFALKPFSRYYFNG